MEWRWIIGAILLELICAVRGLDEADIRRALAEDTLDEWASASVLGLQRGFALHKKAKRETSGTSLHVKPPQGVQQPQTAELQKEAVAGASILGLQRSHTLHRKAVTVEDDLHATQQQVARKSSSAESGTPVMRSSSE
mmetsp:Transcript_29513/g.68053  ORF Transcript_29513/g.68053 Transcript_29513/m.68053 type:complete len:138 (+) Transcript_29513:139-552(+)